MTDVSVSVVAMLDVSGSMSQAMPMVIIDGKAFIRSARPADQIAVVKFESTASMVYPSNQALITVDGQMTVTAAAAAAIATLRSGDMTDMGDAVNMAAAMMAGATNTTKAYMLLSDGNWNVGPDPNAAMPSNVPVFICGLGSGMSQSYVSGMLSKNANSRYIASPNAYQMMQVFNSIRGLAAQAAVPTNVIQAYSGTDYSLTPVTIAGTSDEVQFSVVWSDASISYTSGQPDANHVNLVLIDPSGASTPYQPVIADPGYAIFALNAPQTGVWQILTQYAVANPLTGTHAGFEYDTVLHLDLKTPTTVSQGSGFTIRAELTDAGSPIENAAVSARVTKPQFELPAMLAQHRDAIARHQDANPDHSPHAALQAVLEQTAPGVEHFPYASTYVPLVQAEDGSYQAEVGATERSGAYNVEVIAKGASSKSRAVFSRTGRSTVLAEATSK